LIPGKRAETRGVLGVKKRQIPGRKEATLGPTISGPATGDNSGWSRGRRLLRLNISVVVVSNIAFYRSMIKLSKRPIGHSSGEIKQVTM